MILCSQVDFNSKKTKNTRVSDCRLCRDLDWIGNYELGFVELGC